MGKNAKIMLQIHFTETLLRRSYRDFPGIVEEGRNYDTTVYTS
jgi:hypothetical protein